MFLRGVSLFWNYTETTEHLVMLDCLLGWRVRELSENERPLEGSEPWSPPSYLQVGEWVSYRRAFHRLLGHAFTVSVLGWPVGATLKQMPFQLCSP